MAGTTVNPNNFSLGPCTVAYNGVNLGATEGAVTVAVEETQQIGLSHQTGVTPQRIWGRGHTAMVRAAIQEVTVSNLESLLGATTTAGLTTLGYGEVAVAKTARNLVLTPLDTNAPFGNIRFEKVVPRIGGDQGLFNGENPDTLNVEFQAVWDTGTQSLMQWGSVDITSPTLNSSTPSNGATGVAVAATATFTFSEQLGAGSIHNGNVLLMRDSTNTTFSCTVSLSSDIITAYPAASVSGLTLHHWILTNITDRSGNKISAPVFVRFTTV